MVRSANSRSPSRWPKWPRRSAPAWPRRRWPARSTARSSTPATASKPTRAGHRHRQGRRTAWRCIRHSTAHLLAYAVKELFPEAQVTIGPVIENGFFYDFSYKRPFTPEDLVAIEAAHDRAGQEGRAGDAPRAAARRGGGVLQEPGRACTRPRSSPASRPTRTCRCTAKATSRTCAAARTCRARASCKHFKLMKVAGAYWRGDHRNEMLQRIYGTAWATKDELQQYLTMLEEAEKRDHRKLGRELDLFHLDEHSPGTVFWHPKGWTVWQQVEQYMRARLPRQRLPGGQGPADPGQERCGRRRATGTSTATTCSRPSRKSASTRSSR